MRLVRGLPDAHRAEAAALYWQAFGDKLGRVLGPDRMALAYLVRVMRADHCIVALDGTGVLGLVGFRTDAGSFAGGTLADLRHVYGRFGGAWRGAVLQLIAGPDGPPAPFLVDGLCVHRAMRGQGVGSTLLRAVCEEARARGHEVIRLDVVDTNIRARALYERHGFVLAQRTPIGPMRLVFGYRAALTMEHVL